MKKLIGILFLFSITFVLIIGQSFSENIGKATSLVDNKEPGLNAASNSLQLDVWQLREFKIYSGQTPVFDFLPTVDSTLRVNSTYLSQGIGYIFAHVKRADLDGNKIQVRWNCYYDYPDARDLQFLKLYVYDRAFNRTEMADYFQEDLGREPMFDYTHILLAIYPGPLGASGWLGWRTDTSDTLNLAGWGSDYVTILISTYDAWTSRSVVGDFDWIKILDNSDNEIGSFDFSVEVLMEVTGTYHDYGLLQEVTSFYVDPPITMTGVNTFFNIDVKVSNVTDLYSWEFKLYYRNTILNATQVLEGPFLNSTGFTLWMDGSDYNYNATHGVVHVGASLTGEIPGVNGSGVLASVTFRTLSSGNSTLNLQDTIATSSSISDIAHTASNGFVTVGGHNLVVLSVNPDKSVVGNSELCAMHVSVTVQNQGDFAESFNITAYFNVTIIGMETITDLTPSTNTTREFVWCPTGVPKGNYTVGATASVVPDETNTGDNTLYNTTIIAVAMPGDIAGQGSWPDGIVNIKDLALLATAWGSNYGQPNYKPNCDINDDHVINIKDVAILGRNWGKTDP